MNSDSKICTQTTCPYCGVGCGIDAQVSKDNKLEVRGSEQHTANLGRLCVKGSALADTLSTTNRLLYPEVNGSQVSWDEALKKVADGFKEIIHEHGPDSVAFYLSGQLLTEDYYVANKLMKGFIGSSNVDTNSRLCMASAVASYKRAFGADAVPCNYEDLEICDLLILAGSNAAWTHPVLYQRISAAKRQRPQMKVVVIDPRKTATCEIADIHLQLLPGSDAFLFNGLINFLEKENFLNKPFIDQYCDGYEEVMAASKNCGLASVENTTGLSRQLLIEFYSQFAKTTKVVSFYSQGINQSATGTDKCNAIINCHLLTGRIGKPGMGPFSITGQPNAMGGREVGGLANQLAAHMDYSPETVERVGRFWQAPNMASEPGFKAVDLFEAIAEGKIKAVWIMATNPAVSLPQSARVREALDACDLVVVSDCVRDTDTNSYADVLLPATGWSEKDGTVTNSERNISRQRALFPPAGNARHDWQIICDIASLMGFAEAFDYNSPRDIFVEHAALSDFENNGERAFNIGKLQTLSDADYNSFLPMQWPVTDSNPRGTTRLFTDLKFFTVNAKAKLIPIEAKLPKVSKSLKFPFILNTGRVRDQWHTMTRTGLSSKLLAHFDAPFAQLNPQSSREIAVEDGDLIEISSLNGSILVPVLHDSGIRPGEVFVPIHWSDQFSSNAGVGKIISARVDSISGQPETKLEAVALKAVAMCCWISFCSIREIDVKGFGYWHKTPLKKGFRYLMAIKASEGFDLKFWIQSEFPESDRIEFIDEDQNDYRIACFEKGKLAAIAYSAKSHRSLPAPNWLSEILESKQHGSSWQLLAGKALNKKDVGKIICSCHEVGENQIIDAILAGCVDHEELGNILRCGTNCGSCIPELMQLVNQYQGSVEKICSVNHND